MPQGFSDSPHMFVKCTKPIMAVLRQALVDIVIYIDDTFLRTPTSHLLKHNLTITRDIFQNCGLTINEDKSCTSPTQIMDFLGFTLNSVQYTIAVTPEKRLSLKKLISPIVLHPTRKISLRLLAKIIGKIVSFFPASDKAKLHYRALERFKVRKLSELKQWSGLIRLDSRCLTELCWCLKYLNTPIVKSLSHRKHTQVIFTDSSDIGFGSMWNGEKFQGLFTEKQRALSINTKELLAIYYTLSTYAKRLKNEVVLIRCDNMTALYCIQSFGSRDHLRDTITKKVFALADMYNFQLQISYVKSGENISDVASRKFPNKSVHTEWSLSSSDFKRVLELSSVTPNIDMFASKVNAKLPQFISWLPQMCATHVDAFTVDWHHLKGFLFPPFNLISHVLKKCVDDKVQHLCGVFPLWLTKSWWPTLLKLSGGRYTKLDKAGQHLSLPWDPTLNHPMGSRLTLIFVNLSFNFFTEVRCLKPKQLMSHNMRGAGVLLKNTRV